MIFKLFVPIVFCFTPLLLNNMPGGFSHRPAQARRMLKSLDVSHPKNENLSQKLNDRLSHAMQFSVVESKSFNQRGKP